MQRIAVLLYENDKHAESAPYVLWLMKAEWENRGIEVQVVRGLEKQIDADLLFPHIDLTVIPDEYAAFISAFPNALNKGVRDISKRAVSTNLLTEDDDYEGRVMVKTNLNCAGLPDSNLRGVLPKVGAPRDPYRIYDSLEDVPRSVFEDDWYVIERFLPERHGDQYATRHLYFLGSAHRSSRILGPDPIVKSVGATDISEIDPAPEIVKMRSELGFDYGKFDYVIHDGRVVLLDTNSTPAMSDRTRPERHLSVPRTLARGVEPWLDISSV